MARRRAELFAAASGLGLVGTVVAGAVFALLLGVVLAEWAPARELDLAVTNELNDLVADRPGVVTVLRVLTDLGGSPTSWLIVTVLVLWLLIRRLPRLAVYAAVTGVGAAVLSPAVKELVGRTRPAVEVVVATAPGRSFPSGHALGSTVAYGLLLLVFLPAIPGRARAPLAVAATTLLAGIGFTRVALGVHYVSDVLAGWALGAAWLGVTAAAFRTWRRTEGRPVPPLAQGLAPEAASDLRPASDARLRDLPSRWTVASGLVVGWVLLFGILLGAGLLVTEVLAGTVVDRADAAVMRWFVSMRNPVLTGVSDLASPLGGTAVILGVSAAAAAVSLAVSRRWRAPLFLGAVMLGEVTLFLAATTVVGRTRPAVPHLGPELPPTSSFPSGHAAAAIAAYGSIALLVLAWNDGRRRWVTWLTVSAGILLPLLVAAARLYRGVHFPSDVLGSVLLSLTWLAVCWRLFDPPARPPPRAAVLGTALRPCDGSRPAPPPADGGSEFGIDRPGRAVRRRR